MTKVENQFSKYALKYNHHNIIQQLVSKALVRDIITHPKRILELGCGSGQIFKNIDFDFDYYKAIDFSQSMCDIHPKNNNLDIICLDFDTDEFFNNIKDEQYDIVLSSSALQWSQNLSNIVFALKDITHTINMVLFTSNTFQKIFDITDVKSPILDINSIKNSFDIYFECEYEVINYKLEFKTKKELFKYIKNSGVSGDLPKLSYAKAKNLYQLYPYNYLEFEVIFIKGKKC